MLGQAHFGKERLTVLKDGWLVSVYREFPKFIHANSPHTYPTQGLHSQVLGKAKFRRFQPTNSCALEWALCLHRGFSVSRPENSADATEPWGPQSSQVENGSCAAHVPMGLFFPVSATLPLQSPALVRPPSSAYTNQNSILSSRFPGKPRRDPTADPRNSNQSKAKYPCYSKATLPQPLPAIARPPCPFPVCPPPTLLPVPAALTLVGWKGVLSPILETAHPLHRAGSQDSPCSLFSPPVTVRPRSSDFSPLDLSLHPQKKAGPWASL